jgi:threonine dehydrogenase-like Zn-dependent dehydrogenase
MRALVVTASRHAEVQELPDPVASPGLLLVAVERVGICGTDVELSTGDTMLGCGHCDYCTTGHHHVCPKRFEAGIRDDWAAALAEKLLVPTRFAFAIPENVSVTSAALVEPGGNSLRVVRAAAIEQGNKVLVLGSGTIGLMAAQFALAEGFGVHVASVREGSLELARTLGVRHTEPRRAPRP